MRKAFAQKGFGRLFTGVSTSMFGDSVMLIVLSMWVKSLTGSNAAAGMTFFWLVLPSLFAPVFGLFVDRVRRRPLLVWANVASGVCVLPLLLVRDAGDVWLIYAVAFVYGISFVVVPAGLNGLLKEVMPPGCWSRRTPRCRPSRRASGWSARSPAPRCSLPWAAAPWRWSTRRRSWSPRRSSGRCGCTRTSRCAAPSTGGSS